MKPDFEGKTCSDFNRIFISSGGLWGAFGVDFRLILGSFFGPQPEKHIFWETCSRLHGSMLFKGPRGSKNHEKRVRKQCAAGGVLQERLGRLSGSIWEHFELHFGPQNRPKSKLKFEANFEAIF